MRITRDTRILDAEPLRPFARFLMYKVNLHGRPAEELSIGEMCEGQATWDADTMVRGANRLLTLAERGQVMWDVYPPEERGDDPEKADIKLLYMPAEQQPSDKPFVVGVSGGGFHCVCSLEETVPVAARLNALGYNMFIFNYRCGQTPLFPKPLDDLAAAIRLILENREAFGIVNTEYIVNGYSAGGNLTALWGTEAFGWAHYGLPRPRALFPIYAPISLDAQRDNPWKAETRRATYGGVDYDVPRHFTDRYPPCYIVHAKDDPAVPVRNGEWLRELLEARGIPAALELIETGGHGWGDGSGTDAAGWPDRAAAFERGL